MLIHMGLIVVLAGPGRCYNTTTTPTGANTGYETDCIDHSNTGISGFWTGNANPGGGWHSSSNCST